MRSALVFEMSTPHLLSIHIWSVWAYLTSTVRTYNCLHFKLTFDYETTVKFLRDLVNDFPRICTVKIDRKNCKQLYEFCTNFCGQISVRFLKSRKITEIHTASYNITQIHRNLIPRNCAGVKRSQYCKTKSYTSSREFPGNSLLFCGKIRNSSS